MSEFDLINQYFKTASVKRDDVLLGIGDDCAMLSPPPGKVLAVSTDTLISGVHFPETTSAEDIGYKSLAVNLSDLAAMGAEPAWVSLAITLPEANTDWLAGFMRGFNELASQFNVALIGGDTTQGALSISLTITGFVEAQRALKRSEAKVGDHIFVSGTVGDACVGLDAVLNNLPMQSHIQHCVLRLNRPQAQVELGLLLNQFSAAAIDISDGLIADLQHICKASGVGASINLQDIPLSKSLLQFYNNEPKWHAILTAGDDYELCFTCPESQVMEMQNVMRENELSVTCIGKITDTQRLTCKLNEEIFDFKSSGYNHF